MDSLGDLLSRARLTGRDKLVARQQLKYPWCWPAEGVLLERAEAVAEAPPSPMPGEVLLVSARTRPDSSRTPQTGAVHAALMTSSSGGEARLDFDTRALRRALAKRAEGLGASLSRLPFSLPPCHLVQLSSEPEAQVLSGGSFGLAFVLSAVSWQVQLPVPASVAATAVVLEGDRLGPVEGLEAKLAALAAHAPGVRQVWVCADQLAEARGLVERLPGLEVRGASTAGEVVEALWPKDSEAAMLPPEELSRRIDEIYRASVSGQLSADWPKLARLLERAAESDELEPRARSVAKYTAAIAHRHAGRTAPLPALEGLAGLPRPSRLLDAAQRLQQALDGGEGREGFEALLRQVRRQVAAPLERHREDLIVLAMLGRAEVGLGREAAAVKDLDAALEGMLAGGWLEDMSYPLCALVHCGGVLGDRSVVDRAEDYEDRWRWGMPHAEARAPSEPFVMYAFGRARAQLARARRGMAEPARDRLARVGDDVIYLAEGARLWLTRLAEAPSGGLEDLRRLAAGPCENQTHNARALARIELGRRTNDGMMVEEGMRAFRRIWPGELERMFPDLEGDALVEALLLRSRY